VKQHRDQRDRGEVVNDRQRQQQHAHSGRQRRADEREDAEGEGDVGRDGDRPRPAVGGGATRHGDCEQRWHDHPAGRREEGQRGRAAVGELSDRELALELQPGDEEEQRQQPVGDPVAERQMQLEPAGTELRLGIPHRRVAGVRDVRPHECDRGRRSSSLPPLVSSRTNSANVSAPSLTAPRDAAAARAT